MAKTSSTTPPPAWHAITHVPSLNMNDAIRTHAAHDTIRVENARRQHDAYRAALADAGATVHVLEVNASHPDAVFIEDTAVVLEEIAVIAAMAAPSRKDEPKAIEPELAKQRATIKHIEAPDATLEGGDVIRLGKTLLVGRTARTNPAGAAALASIVQPYGYSVKPVHVEGCLHLKSACTALPNGALLLNRAWLPLAETELAGFDLVNVPVEEPHGANVVVVGADVIMSSAYPRTADLITERHARAVHRVDLSEFSKADGCATCLSLVFSAKH